MPQERFWNLLDDDLTDRLNHWFIGILVPGVYRGFDFVANANMTLTLNHDTTGFKDVTQSEELTGFKGVLLTQQGIIIKEDTPINLPVAASDFTHPRIDRVVVTHEYNENLAGGSQAVYSVITGTADAAPVAPALTDANKQISIGTIYIPANTLALNEAGVIWTKSAQPDFANNGLLASANNLQSQITDNAGDIVTINGTLSSLQTQISNNDTDIATLESTKQDVIDASNRLPADLIADGSVSDTEFQYINSLSSNAQSQLNSLQSQISANDVDITNLQSSKADKIQPVFTTVTAPSPEPNLTFNVANAKVRINDQGVVYMAGYIEVSQSSSSVPPFVDIGSLSISHRPNRFCSFAVGVTGGGIGGDPNNIEITETGGISARTQGDGTTTRFYLDSIIFVKTI